MKCCQLVQTARHLASAFPHVNLIYVNLCLASQVVKLVQEIGAITVRGNHDEIALERYHSWKTTGTLDVSSSIALFDLLNVC